MMRTRPVALLLALVLVVAACGSSDDDADDATTTTEAATTTTTAAAGPLGEPALVPLLLTPAEFGAGLAPSDATESVPKAEYCKGVKWPVEWEQSATTTVSAEGAAPTVNTGYSESIMRFAPGDAATFIAAFTLVNMKCVGVEGGVELNLTPTAGMGDEGFRGTAKAGLPFELALVRVGDDVISLVGLSNAPPPIISDELITKAVAKLQQG